MNEMVAVGARHKGEKSPRTMDQGVPALGRIHVLRPVTGGLAGVACASCFFPFCRAFLRLFSWVGIGRISFGVCPGLFE